ncbi:alpha-glucosidase (plasmid) [Deinococcus psychrotolerans]|uniref:Alpha-glucosidase n=1 Tax=Deinococcus psychrotolerans TaxID=2489213 RepID=A0A3G8YPR6_9DEIO|nr:alpha-glucosidase [Deinococcus psychrotolerans]AZI44604.1 alpha-glucosidase [Deinococcus psychrotolerans]
MTSTLNARPWFKDAVVYQIYPRSFQDSNGDGIGDLRGILSRLDYLARLGVDVLWLSPIFASPNDDNGYDISDYRAIMAEFGTMADFDELLAAAHQRGLKIMLDLVVNHSSDEHPWFVEARDHPDSEKRDYYIWKPPVNGDMPTHWQAFFGGPVWQLDEASGEYYLHLFSVKQPDLNWENPKLRAEVYDLMRFWLDKGIDGFRMDVINLISKDQAYPDAEPITGTALTSGYPYFMNGPRVHEFLQEMNREVLSHYDLMTVGETPGASVDDAVRYSDPQRGELDMVFQFEHVGLGSGERGKWSNLPWTLPELKSILSRWQTGLHNRGWNSLYWDNHDQPRAVSRFGNDSPEFRVPSAKMLATLLHFMQGTPYIYQGEEFGMTNVRFERVDQYDDLETLGAERELRELHGWSEERIMASIHAMSRDNARTPVQWDASPNAGFTSGKPWLEINPNYPNINAEAAEADLDSVWHHYKHLIALRKSLDVVRDGTYELLDAEHPSIYAYLRSDGHTKLLIVAHFSAKAGQYRIPAEFVGGEVLSNNYSSLQLTEKLNLEPYQAVVIRAK